MPDFDPLSPTHASTSKDKSTFHTLDRERRFRHLPKDASDVKALDELVRPHLDSFNALTEGPDGDSKKGLLNLGIHDIGEKAVFDGKATDRRPFGQKISCRFSSYLMSGGEMGG